MSRVEFHPQKLADFISLKRGHDLPESQRLPGEVPVVSSAGITGFHNEAKCEGPGVVTGRYGTLGELHYVEGSYWPLNTTLYVDDFKGNDPRFVYYFLQTLDLAQFNGAGAVPGLNRNALAMIDVALPKLDDQKVIAEQLTSFDLLADNLKRQIRILEDAARLIYTEWFVRLRFPGHIKTKTNDSLPDGWRRDRVDSVLTLQRGFDLPADQRVDGDIPVIASTGVCGTHSLPKVSGPGVVTGRSGTLGKVHLILKDFWPLNTTLWVKEYRGISPYFAYFLLQDLNLASLNVGASVPSLDRNTVHPLPIIAPDTMTLAKFDEAVIPIFQQIDTLERQIKHLKSARDLLLPRLISGQLRL